MRKKKLFLFCFVAIICFTPLVVLENLTRSYLADNMVLSNSARLLNTFFVAFAGSKSKMRFWPQESNFSLLVISTLTSVTRQN